MRLAGVISKPQVIIPMSGTGKRFVDAGYILPKFLECFLKLTQTSNTFPLIIVIILA
jgi:hypothetical protein